MRSPRLLSLALGLGLAACTGSQPSAPARPAPQMPAMVAGAGRAPRSDLTPEDTARFERAWDLFVTHDPQWTSARDEWLSRGPAARYLLAENLFRYFWHASSQNRRDEVARVANEAKLLGAQTVPFYAQVLVTDQWPLPKPVTVKVFNPDNIHKPITKTFTHYDIDDLTRQHATYVLATIGPPAVPTLSSPSVLDSKVSSARRYASYALGAIATDQAVATLTRLLETSKDWQDRAAAAMGLGFALHRNPAARAPLEKAKGDPDEFVRRKVEEALEGRTKIPF